MMSTAMPLTSSTIPEENLQVVASSGAREGQRILGLKGALTIHTIFGFQGAVNAENALELILDMSGVPFVDSAGLGTLVAMYLRAQKTMCKLVLAGVNDQVKALAEMTQVSQFFPIYPTVKDAQTALSQQSLWRVEF